MARAAAVGRRVRFADGIRRAYPGLRVATIERSAEREIVVLCQSAVTEAWCRLELEVDEHPPHGIALGFTYAAPPSYARHPRALDRQSIARAVDRYVDRLVDANLFSGVVAVGDGGRPWLSRAYGRAEAVDQRFGIASMSKMFTAVAIAQLAQQRRLAFSDPIGRHLPDYPRADVAGSVTIEQLLTHTSGLGDYLDDAAFQAARAAGRTFATPRDYFPYFASEPLAFAPGERFEYSNAGYVVLGEIVARVSGRDYFDYVTEFVLRPAGMHATDPRGTHGSPAGSAVSTAGDLLRFAHALHSHRLLDPGHTKLVLAPRVEAPFGGSYAYGFFVRHRGTPDRIVGHDGESAGVNALLDLYMAPGTAVVVLADQDPPSARNVASKLETLLLRPPASERRRAVTQPRASRVGR